DSVDARNPSYAEREKIKEKRKHSTRLAKEFLATRVATNVTMAEADRDYERREAESKLRDQVYNMKSCLLLFLLPAGLALGLYGLTQGSALECISGIGLIVGYFVARNMLINSN